MFLYLLTFFTSGQDSTFKKKSQSLFTLNLCLIILIDCIIGKITKKKSHLSWCGNRNLQYLIQ